MHLSQFQRKQRSHAFNQGFASFIGEIFVNDDRKRVYRVASDENVQADHGRDAETCQMVVQRSVPARHGLQAVVEIQDDFVQRHFVTQEDAATPEMFELLLNSTLLFQQLQN